MAKDKIKLDPTYGNFELKGKVKSIDEIKTGKTGAGDEYKSLKVHVSTDEYGVLVLDLFGQVREQVPIVKFKGKEVEQSTTNWADRNDIPEGWSLSNLGAVGIGTDVAAAKKRGGLTYQVAYDAIDTISEGFEEGDSVRVSGSIRFADYVNRTGDKMTVVNYNIGKMYKIDEVDFEDEEFQPYVKFDQPVVIASKERVAKFSDDVPESAVILHCYIVDSKENFYPYDFVVFVGKREKLAKNLYKLADYTQIPLKGDIVNKALTETKTESNDDWGFDDQQTSIKGYIRYYEILTADANLIIEGKYTEDDFVVTDILDDKEEKPKKKAPVKEVSSKPKKEVKEEIEETEEENDPFAGFDDAEDIDSDWLAED